MTYFDQHLHTHHSFDSSERFENYLALAPKTLVTTEHLDFNNPGEQFKDSLPDYQAYTKEINRLQKTFTGELLRGVEIGFVAQDWPKIEAYLADKTYDVQLLSVHQNGRYDYMEDQVKTVAPDVLIKEYYEQMLVAVQTVTSANILTHFDYGVRRLGLSAKNYQQLAEPYLIPLFKEVIKQELAFELNAKSFLTYNNQALYDYAVPLYRSLGGKLFTLGSDAHVAEDYQLGFPEMAALLKKNGVTELATYRRQQLTLVAF